MPLNKFNFLFFLIFSSIFFYSYFFFPHHNSADQLHYRKAFEAVKSIPFFDALKIYRDHIHSDELIHFFLIWITSSIGISKNIVMSFANALLATLFAMLLKQKNASVSLIFFLTISSYYLQVLFFDLERLKFAFIFLFLYLLYLRRWLIIPAIFSHVFIIIPIILSFLSRNIFMQKDLTSKLSSKKSLFSLQYTFILFVICITTIMFLWTHIIHKLEAYLAIYEGNRILETWKLAIFYIATWITCFNKKSVFFYFFNLVLLASLIGDSRINMLGYFGFLYFSNFKNRNFMYLIFFFILYFFFKSVDYIYDSYNFGVTFN
jgi:hypothetical protein